jgi:hypothetical protein
MDFLDPKAKRRHTIRLFIGYGLMGTLIGIITLILVFQAYGFDVDRKTGEVIQNGLVFVDSAPDKATVLFNNSEQKDKTNNRFALPSGPYDMRIRKAGYREWHRNFSLVGGEVERYNYPLLIPTTLPRQEFQTFDAAPTFASESPDRRWAIMNQANSLTSFVEFDYNTLTNAKPASRTFAAPANLFTPAAGDHALELVEWSNDNKHLLIKHTFSGRSEFVLLSRDQPADSININTLLGQNPTTVTLRDKKFDQWYVYTQAGGILQTADTKKSVATVLEGVTSFKSHGTDTLLYSQAGTDGKSQRVTLQQGKDSYVLKDLADGAVFLDIARYSGSWYVVAGSDAEQKTYVYRDPVTVLQKRDGTKATPISILKATSPLTSVSFSQNTRFVLAQSGQHFGVFDAEKNQSFNHNLSNPIDAGTKVVWMDGHRLLARSAGKAVMFDFDGSNKQELVASLPQAPIMFDRDYTVMYDVDVSAAAAGKTGYYGIQLRLPGDK